MILDFEKLNQELADAQEAIKNIDDDLGSIKFDPYDETSIEEAIQQVYEIITNRICAFSSNPLIESFIKKTKEDYFNRIHKNVEIARVLGEGE